MSTTALAGLVTGTPPNVIVSTLIRIIGSCQNKVRTGSRRLSVAGFLTLLRSTAYQIYQGISSDKRRTEAAELKQTTPPGLMEQAAREFLKRR
ncbi:hypothetical protein [Bradyrhizobium australafricanum]|uniref:hypothetical protein n=1 Tax=Bradyrhizobium australafricanum TaxID=2821406 RepID=UPI001CE3513A|nr:hypothetical protein [Bradyrhizobium australafricanum]MCA6101044.1 hypothetical protein [Bradyrhizobium australafricanum]